MANKDKMLNLPWQIGQEFIVKIGWDLGFPCL
jgi:hypothetical protein